jgi:hypothetical protein
MKYSLYLIVLILAACSSEQESYTHSLTKGDGISAAEISYSLEATGLGTTGALDLIEAATPIVETSLEAKDIIFEHVQNGNYSIDLKEGTSTSTFTEIPEKFINLDAEVTFSRKVFESIFPKEWEPMKGTDYSTIVIKSKKDNQVFYTQAVSTGTNKQIAQYSEDF